MYFGVTLNVDICGPSHLDLHRLVGAPRRSCLRPSPQYEYGKDGWPLHPSIGSTHAVQTSYV